MTDQQSDDDLRNEIIIATSKVAYFHNIAGPGPGICDVCRGPAPESGICSTCLTTRGTLLGATCDHTFFLAYADGYNPAGRTQSVQTMRNYKADPAPERSVDDVQLLTFTTTWIHDPCMRAAEGAEWDVATFVPSRTSRTGPHPVTGIARNVARLANDDPASGGKYQIKRVLMECGPVNVSRVANAARFAVPDAARPLIEGKRVLLVDDTWTTGTSLQSAAAALRAAGAAAVTGLCVARWLSWNWAPEASLLEKVTVEAFDPFSCIAGTHKCRLIPHRP
ncbi:phosphoribosyltransferase [Mycobacterium sp. 050128]|uniref:phosphoribosyltransferase n=1 Tax=Mycobacterium sp. 050128 TaxID=3096112 RepID=UPI002EDB8976